MIIDAHSHVHDPLDRHLALLDEAEVDRTILFVTRPHPERATDLAGLRAEFDILAAALDGTSDPEPGYRRAWRELDIALAAHPDRFLGFGAVRLDLSAAEIEQYVDREVIGRGLRGIGELTPPPGAAARVEPVLRSAADHGGLPVVIHGAAPATNADLRTLAELSGRYPSVPLVIGQLGGQHWFDAIELVRDTPGMYLELSTAPVIFAVRHAIAALPDRTLFGSDAPYGDPVLARAAVERVTSAGEVRDRVLGDTLAELLGL